jgi:hypothetical protein
VNIEPCDDYRCEGGQDHAHVGVQPHLRRVIGYNGELIDGQTGLAPTLPRKEDADGKQAQATAPSL